VGADTRIVTLYTKESLIAMLIFVRMQNSLKLRMGAFFPVQNTQNFISIYSSMHKVQICKEKINGYKASIAVHRTGTPAAVGGVFSPLPPPRVCILHAKLNRIPFFPIKYIDIAQIYDIVIVVKF